MPSPASPGLEVFQNLFTDECWWPWNSGFYVIDLFAVTEREITQGILKNSQSEDTCLCVMRKIPDIELHLTDPKAPKFIDLASQKEVDNEAQELLRSLRSKKVPSKVQNTNLPQVESPKSVVLGQLWLRFYSELSSVATLKAHLH